MTAIYRPYLARLWHGAGGALCLSSLGYEQYDVRLARLRLARGSRGSRGSRGPDGLTWRASSAALSVFPIPRRLVSKSVGRAEP